MPFFSFSNILIGCTDTGGSSDLFTINADVTNISMRGFRINSVRIHFPEYRGDESIDGIAQEPNGPVDIASDETFRLIYNGAAGNTVTPNDCPESEILTAILIFDTSLGLFTQTIQGIDNIPG